MSGLSVGGSQPIIPQQSQPIEKKTTLEKGVDVLKENTKKGTLVGDHYVAVGAGTLVGGVAAVSGAVKLANAVPAVDKALSVLTSKGTLGAVALTGSAVLAEDAAKSFKDGKTVKGLAESGGAAVVGLGGVELVGRQFNIKYADRALSATGEFLGKNSLAIVGAGASAGGAYAIKSGVDDIKDGKKVLGTAKVAAGSVGVLGGVELVGRQFNIPIAREALTGVPKRLLSTGVGLTAAGGAIALTGGAAAVDGVRRMTTGKGIVNDAIGVAELTAGTAAITGGASVIGIATKSEALKSVFPKTVDVIGGVALGAGAVALGKHTANSIKEKGLTVGSAATGTASALAALGSTQVLANKFGVPVLDKAISKTWQPVVAVGLGVAAFKLGKDAISESKENVTNGLGKGAGALVLGGASAAIAGKALNIPVLNTMGEKVLTTAGKVVEPVVEFAVKNPGKTLAAVAVAGGVGAYMYYQKKN